MPAGLLVIIAIWNAAAAMGRVIAWVLGFPVTDSWLLWFKLLVINGLVWCISSLLLIWRWRSSHPGQPLHIMKESLPDPLILGIILFLICTFVSLVALYLGRDRPR